MKILNQIAGINNKECIQFDLIEQIHKNILEKKKKLYSYKDLFKFKSIRFKDNNILAYQKIFLIMKNKYKKNINI